MTPPTVLTMKTLPAFEILAGFFRLPFVFRLIDLFRRLLLLSLMIATSFSQHMSKDTFITIFTGLMLVEEVTQSFLGLCGFFFRLLSAGLDGIDIYLLDVYSRRLSIL